MGSDVAEKIYIPTQTEITRLDLDSCSGDDLCISSLNVGDGRAAEEVSSNKSRCQDVQEILREQLVKAQETLAANHEHALLLLSRGLAQSRLQNNIDDEPNGWGGVRTAAHGSGSSATSSSSFPSTSLQANRSQSSASAPASSKASAGRAKENSHLPGMLHGATASEPGRDAAPTSDAQGAHFPPVDDIDEIIVQPPPVRFTRHDQPAPPSEMAPNLVALPALTDQLPCGTSDEEHLESSASAVSAVNVKPKGVHFGEQPTMSVSGSVISEKEEEERATLCYRTGSQDNKYKYDVLPSWKKDAKQAFVQQIRGKTPRNKNMHRTGKNVVSLPQVFKTDDPSENPDQVRSRCVLHPHSTKRFVWDLCSLVLVTYDMAIIPLSFFDPPVNDFMIFCAWVTRLFWTCDIFASFVTGFLKHDGSTEMHFVKIARRYILSWLLLDILIVGIDWFEVLMLEAGSMSAARLVKSSRAIRILRLVRLLRLFRMQTVLHQLAEGINSETLLVVLDIIKMIVLIMGMAHLLGCIWYSIGAGDHPTTWVKEYGFERLSLSYRYTTSLHWSLSQLTGGMDEVTPCNTAERTYVILVFLMTFIVAAVFVSHITSSMTRLHMITSHQSLQLSVLRKYFQQNKISKRLAARVFRNAKNASAEKQRFTPEENVELLNLVSEPLREELHFEMFAPILEVHRFFKRYIEECPQVMRKVCHSATDMTSVSPGDLVFTNGEMPSAPMMYFVVSGGLQYTTVNGEVNKVAPGDCLSEASLWTPWMHRGDLEAFRECRLCTIDAKQFAKIVCQFEHAGFDPRDRAADFVRKLNTLDEDITDLDYGRNGVKPASLQSATLEQDEQSTERDAPSSTKSWISRSVFT
mmetsp:Transcript_153113/g.293223  ORF Transcript_153113/g.293223 Transcript_153113/m.293223 type:complete len:862 (-) Transcript_153113:33-2618(-)